MQKVGTWTLGQTCLSPQSQTLRALPCTPCSWLLGRGEEGQTGWSDRPEALYKLVLGQQERGGARPLRNCTYSQPARLAPSSLELNPTHLTYKTGQAGDKEASSLLSTPDSPAHAHVCFINFNPRAETGAFLLLPPSRSCGSESVLERSQP